jgi:hypothetical protein
VRGALPSEEELCEALQADRRHAIVVMKGRLAEAREDGGVGALPS